MQSSQHPSGTVSKNSRIFSVLLIGLSEVGSIDELPITVSVVPAPRAPFHSGFKRARSSASISFRRTVPRNHTLISSPDLAEARISEFTLQFVAWPSL